MKKLLYIIFIINLAAVIGIWYSRSGTMVLAGAEYTYVAFGQLAGLLAEFFILLQIVLIGRIKFIEREFGHDKLNRYHRAFGKVLAFAIIFHPIFLLLGFSKLNQTGLYSQFRDFIFNWDDVAGAAIAIILIIFAGIVSLRKIRAKIKYEQWHFNHLFIYLAIYLAFGHQTETGVVSYGAASYYWLTLNYTVFGLLVLFRFVKPLFDLYRFRFRVEKTVKEVEGITSVYISGKNLKGFKYEPGQFANLLFLQRKMWTPHPFSFSVAPNENHLRFTIKASGDFTETVPNLKPGTPVIIDGPLGIFTERSSKRDKYLLIAGGIGITPIRALMESLTKKNKDTILLFSNRHQYQIPLKDELTKLSPNTHFFLSEPTHGLFSGYEIGRIDKERIKTLVPDVLSREVYICGPDPMMVSMVEILKDLGLKKDQIHHERFIF